MHSRFLGPTEGLARILVPALVVLLTSSLLQSFMSDVLLNQSGWAEIRYTIDRISWLQLGGYGTIASLGGWGLLVFFFAENLFTILGLVCLVAVYEKPSLVSSSRLTHFIVITMVILALLPFLSALFPLPGVFIMAQVGDHLKMVTTLPPWNFYVGGSASPYNIRFLNVTPATATVASASFTGFLDLESPDGPLSTAIVAFLVLKPTNVQDAVQRVLSRHPGILGRIHRRLSISSNAPE